MVAVVGHGRCREIVRDDEVEVVVDRGAQRERFDPADLDPSFTGSGWHRGDQRCCGEDRRRNGESSVPNHLGIVVDGGSGREGEGPEDCHTLGLVFGV